MPPAAQETPQRSSGSNRRRTMVAGAGILGVLLAAIVGWTALKGDSGSGVPAPAAVPAAASAPAAVGPAARTEALASLRRADRAAAQDHPAEARRILASIDPAVLAAPRPHRAGADPPAPGPRHGGLPRGNRPGRGRTVRAGAAEDAGHRAVPRRRPARPPLRRADGQGPGRPGARGGRGPPAARPSRSSTVPRRSRPPCRPSGRPVRRRPSAEPGVRRSPRTAGAVPTSSRCPSRAPRRRHAGPSGPPILRVPPAPENGAQELKFAAVPPMTEMAANSELSRATQG